MKPVIGITMGDPAGIGPEIALKALKNREIQQSCIPVIIGDRISIEDANRLTGLGWKLNPVKQVGDAKGAYGTADYLDLSLLGEGPVDYGKVRADYGHAAFQYIVTAIGLALEKKLHAVVTGPICKESIFLAGHHFAGHTEIFSHYTGTKDYAMMLIAGNLRVIHVTTHLSLRDACEMIKKERVLKTIYLADKAMKMIGLTQYKIGVAGLNPHSSENGLFGDEEGREIIPAIRLAQQEGISVEGPIPPDTVFVKAMAGMYDVVVAMYHDQGHIPLKLSGFRMDPKSGRFTSVSGINTTIGLPIIRTSVDHGTAFDKAGKNIANAESMEDALRLAVTMATRQERETC